LCGRRNQQGRSERLKNSTTIDHRGPHSCFGLRAIPPANFDLLTSGAILYGLLRRSEQIADHLNHHDARAGQE